MKQDIGANPLLIFSLVGKIAKANTGNSMLAGFIRQAFHTTNYYQILFEVKQMIEDNYPAMCDLLGE